LLDPKQILLSFLVAGQRPIEENNKTFFLFAQGPLSGSLLKKAVILSFSKNLLLFLQKVPSETK